MYCSPFKREMCYITGLVCVYIRNIEYTFYKHMFIKTER